VIIDLSYVRLTWVVDDNIDILYRRVTMMTIKH